MKKIAFILLVTIGFFLNAQTIDYNTDGGYIAEGYDVVAYFNNNAVKGNKKFTSTHDAIKYKFSSQENLDVFNANPKKYIPQYGGYCAYAIATKGKKVSINPKTFEIRDGKLYLFYNSWGTNTLKLWDKESPTDLVKKANTNWERIKSK